MGIDLKDIVDLIPFIIENASECFYIIAVCFATGFIIGSFFEKRKKDGEHTPRNSQNVSPLSELGRVVALNEGKMDITAFIEFRHKSDKVVHKESKDENV